jgi:hypothetical protein
MQGLIKKSRHLRSQLSNYIRFQRCCDISESNELEFGQKHFGNHHVQNPWQSQILEHLNFYFIYWLR